MSKKCILCLKGEIKVFVNLGKSPLANNLISSKNLNKKEKKYPLVLGKCKKCNHVQLKTLVKPNFMFDNYLYLSSASSTLKKHLSSIPSAINKVKKVKKNDLVVDIGSNDATLLKGYRKFKTRTIGVEPAKNLVRYYKKENIKMINDYFNIKTAKEIKKKIWYSKSYYCHKCFSSFTKSKKFRSRYKYSFGYRWNIIN